MQEIDSTDANTLEEFDQMFAYMRWCHFTCLMIEILKRISKSKSGKEL